MSIDPTTRQHGGKRLRESRPDIPLVSVITVVYQESQELLPLLLNIVECKGPEAEIIVVDGGSTDGTVDLLRKFDDRIDYWISEPDAGIYDAMNKGISLARGHFVLHINAGDRLKHIPAPALRQCLAAGADIACFSVNLVGWGDFPPRTGFPLLLDNSISHQGTFYRRTSHPGYDLSFRILADFDCNQKMILKSGMNAALFQEVVAERLSVGISKTRAADREIYRIVKKNFGTHYAIAAVVWRALAPTRTWIKSILHRIDRSSGNKPQSTFANPE